MEALFWWIPVRPVWLNQEWCEQVDHFLNWTENVQVPLCCGWWTSVTNCRAGEICHRSHFSRVFEEFFMQPVKYVRYNSKKTVGRFLTWGGYPKRILEVQLSEYEITFLGSRRGPSVRIILIVVFKIRDSMGQLIVT